MKSLPPIQPSARIVDYVYPEDRLVARIAPQIRGRVAIALTLCSPDKSLASAAGILPSFLTSTCNIAAGRCS